MEQKKSGNGAGKIPLLTPAAAARRHARTAAPPPALDLHGDGKPFAPVLSQ
ncbi:MAG: hypothetical protein LBT53_05595 [Puniceicoccales bacterium]|nr:hypothetical protein [Puniceicoccales bacterium]